MEIKKCIGCGAILQNTDNQALGYVPDLSMNYCQRCFRLSHYDKSDEYSDLSATHDLSLLENVSGLFVWIVDIIDLETSLNSQFTEFLRNRKFVTVVNKCDLLPETVTENKIVTYVKDRLKNLGLKPRAIIVRGKDDSFRENMQAVLSKQKDEAVFMGIANVGKSTVINDLLGENLLTVNRNPSTTLSLNRIETEYGTMVDSVGLVSDGSVQGYLSSANLKKVVPYRKINPVIYQLSGSQSLAIGGLARIDISDCRKVTAVVYCSNLLKIQRSKQENADGLWQKHYGRELSPVIKGVKHFNEMKKVSFKGSNTKTDICIAGLGWVCLSGEYAEASVYVGDKIGVYERKVLI